MWSYPVVRPEHRVVQRHRAGHCRRRPCSTPHRTSPCVARTYRETFFPGSTFKVVTATAGLDLGQGHRHVARLSRRDQLHAAPHEPGDLQLRRQRVRRNPSDDPGEVVQLVVRRDGGRDPGARSHDRCRPRPPASTRFRRSTCPGPPTSVYPTDFGAGRPDRPDGQGAGVRGHPEARPDRHRSERRPRHTAADGARRGRGRQRRSDHDAARDVGDQGARRRGRDAVRREPMEGLDVAPTAAATLRADMIGVVQNGTARIGRRSRESRSAPRPARHSSGRHAPRSHAWMIAFAGPPGGEATVAVAGHRRGPRRHIERDRWLGRRPDRQVGHRGGVGP